MIKYDPISELPVERGKKIECPNCSEDIVKGISSTIHVLGEYKCVECGSDVTQILINACCRYERKLIDEKISKANATDMENELIEQIKELEWGNNERRISEKLWKEAFERAINTLRYLKLQMKNGKKYGYESDTIFWERCIWEIDEVLGEEPNKESDKHE